MPPAGGALDNLGRMQDNLPPTEVAEKELQQAFRVAALSLTGLFKVGKKATNKAYLAGKREALQDVLEFLQATLDHPPTSSSHVPAAVGPLNVARLIDYICARQETLKAEEELDEENEEQQPPPNRNASSRATTSNIVPPVNLNAARARVEPIPSTSSAPASPMHHPHLNSPSREQQVQVQPTQRYPQPPLPSSASSSSSHYQNTSSNSLTSTPTLSTFLGTPTNMTTALSSSPLGSPSLSLSSSTVPSPLTRLQARSRKGKSSASRTSMIASTSPAMDIMEEEGPSGETMIGSMKRRWGNGSTGTTGSHIPLDEIGGEGRGIGEEMSEEGREADLGENGIVLGLTGDDQMMILDGMEGWDGQGERPNKRINRR